MVATQARQHRRFSLRARLIGLVLIVVALALIAVDVVIPLNVRSTLITGKDRTLSSVIGALPHNITQQALQHLTAQNSLAGEVGWSQVTGAGIAQVIQRPPDLPAANPAVGAQPPTLQPATVADAKNGANEYRILAVVVADQFGQPGFVVAWIPLADVEATVRRLVLLELLITVGLLILVGAAAGLIIRRALRPLELMARTADEIAAGDLTRRVDAGAPGTEIGRLGSAFNEMVDGIGGLLAERTENAARLRQFVADASHELRTPVAAIRGYTDLYRAGALPEEVALDRAMDRMGFESRRMGALVDDLLTLTQADSGESPVRDPVDLAELLTGVVDDAAVIDRTRTWRLAGTAVPAVVRGDRLRLHQLFANLLGNVRTHTSPGSTATVSLLSGVTEVVVLVVDNGPGVSDADLPRLFDRFFRADPSRSRDRGGTGLGLSIAAAIVRSHGGRIQAAHTPGSGLTVSVALPKASGTAAVPAVGESTAQVASTAAAESGSSVPASDDSRADPPEA